MEDIFDLGALADDFNEESVGPAFASSYRERDPLLSQPGSYFAPREDARYLGLHNQGATCYLNTLLQTLYATHELRQRMYDLSPQELGVQFLETREQEAARLAEEEAAGKPQVYQPPQRDIDALTAFGFEEEKVVLALREYPSAGERDAAVDYVLSHEFTQEELDSVRQGATDEVAEAGAAATPSGKAWKVPIYLRKLFAHLQLADHLTTSTEDLTWAFGWSGTNEAGIQQDIHELNRVLLDAIHQSLQTTSDPTLIPDIFSGTLVNRLLCTKCGQMRSVEEEFFDLVVRVQGLERLTDSLNAWSQTEFLTGNNQYRCSMGCDNELANAKRGTCIRALPHILTFSLNRFDFDFVRMARVKVCDRFSFPLVVDMSPYLEQNIPFNPTDEPQPEVAPARAQPAQAQPSEPADPEEVEEIEEDPNAADPADPSCLYDLYSVNIHVGTAMGGHYHCYIRDVLAETPDETFWYDLNDSSVTSIPQKDIAKQYGGKRECAYLLVYRRRTDATPVEPVVPDDLRAEIEELNERLKGERQRYDVLSNEIQVNIVTEERYRSSGDLLIDTVLSNPNADADASEDNNDEADGKQDLGVYKLVIDQRKTVADLLAAMPQAVLDAHDDTPVLHLLETSKGAFKVSGIKRLLPSDETPLQELGIDERSCILAWNGATINGDSFEPREHAEPDEPAEDDNLVKDYMLHVSWMGDDVQDPMHPPTVTITMHRSSSLADLQQLVVSTLEKQAPQAAEALSQVDLDDSPDVLVAFMHKSSIGRVEPRPESENRTFSSVTLWEGGIRDNCRVAFEPRAVEQWDTDSRAAAFFDMLAYQVRLTVQYEVPDADSIETAEVTVDKRGSVDDLHAAILRDIPALAQFTPESTRLRHMSGLSHISTLLRNGELSLIQAEVSEDDMIVRLELQPPPAPTQLELHVWVVPDSESGDLSHTRHPVVVEQSWTVKRCKTAILEATGLHELGRKENQFVLHRMDDAWESCGKVLQNEHVTINKMRMRDGTKVWLQEGKLPIRGLIHLDVFLSSLPEGLGQTRERIERFRAEATASVAALDAEQLKAYDQPPYAGLSPDHALTMVPIEEEMEFSKNYSLLDLKNALLEKDVVASGTDTPSRLRVRVLTKAGMPGALLAAEEVALKSQKVSSDKQIMVQVMPEGSDESQWTREATLMQLYTVVNRFPGVSIEDLKLRRAEAEDAHRAEQIAQAAKRLEERKALESSRAFAEDNPDAQQSDGEGEGDGEDDDGASESDEAMALRLAKEEEEAAEAAIEAGDNDFEPFVFRSTVFGPSPPMQIVVDKLNKAQPDDLRSVVADETGIDVEHLSVLKWFRKDRCWKVICAELQQQYDVRRAELDALEANKPTKKGKKGKNKGKGKKQQPCLKHAPFKLHALDILVAVDRRDFGCASDAELVQYLLDVPWAAPPAVRASSAGRRRLGGYGGEPMGRSTASHRERGVRIEI